ncbi:fungal-specific transcription factor domain-containing protein [Aspergillus fruticulosus]
MGWTKQEKCSGERPVCFHCRRSRHRCVYEPYSTTISDIAVPPPSYPPLRITLSAILQRINMLESRLAELSDRAIPQPLPFRRKLEMGLSPNSLLLAVLAPAQEAIEVYAKGLWKSVLIEHLIVVDTLTVKVVQTVNLLAIVDYTVGRVSSAWLKVGLAGRISQGLRLMIDPSDAVPCPEQEERRRVFWSEYLLDRLISCGKSRPLYFHDNDCHVRLPCDDETLHTGRVQTIHTVHELLCWDSKIDHDQPPSPSSLVILVASIFGRCTRYVHRERNPDKTPPWDTNSEFSKINSLLLLLESYSRNRQTKSVHSSEEEQVVFAHTLFHLSHCLLNHPFLVRLRLKPFGSKVPISFAVRVLQTGTEHANQLLDLLRDASEAGFPLESSFYPYCIVVVERIQSLLFHYEVSKNDPWSSTTLDTSISSLLYPARVSDETGPATMTALWTMLDYGMVGSRVGEPQFLRVASLNIPSPLSWVLGFDIFNTTSLGMGDTHPQLHGGLTPPTHFKREVDMLLHPC